MRIRELKTDISDWEPKSELYSITYQVKTITPIYGGGVEAGEADTEMPIRAAAIRGQLRYWWRFLKSKGKINTMTEKKLIKLYDDERAIWGGINIGQENDQVCSADNGSKNHKKDYNAAGKVNVHVVVNKKAGGKNCNDISSNNSHGIKYALFSVEDEEVLQDKGVEFILKLRANKKKKENVAKQPDSGLTQEQWHEVLLAVRWWANFGGIGARTRRGLGAVEVEGIAQLSNDDVDAYGCKLKQRSEISNSIKAWSNAIDRLFQFRQGGGDGRRQGHGRSYWPEPDTIRELTGKHGHDVEHEAVGSFPRAMFGLPIIFEIRGAAEPPKTHLLPDMNDSSRMASPLIIKPVANGKGGFIPTVLCMPTENLDNLQLKLVIDKKERDKLSGDKRTIWRKKQFTEKLPRNDADPDAWWPTEKNKEEQKKRAAKIKPMENRSHDPLKAFLKFFEEG